MKTVQNKDFFNRNATCVAQDLIGKWLQTNVDGRTVLAQIIETEAYLGTGDSACHTYKGKRTKSNLSMWKTGGTIYVYLCYGLHNMLNLVCGDEDTPETVLIRAVEGAVGPGKTTKLLGVTRQLDGQSILDNDNIKLLDDEKSYCFTLAKRVGIDYALPCDRDALLRFVLKR